jgi:diguanylate cyclase (GGDEF)-like protein
LVNHEPVAPVAITVPDCLDPAVERQFRENRATGLIAVNPNTFWSIAVIVLGFSAWDAFVDPAHWRVAFLVRAVGAAVIVATGLFQKLPDKARWMPFLAKVRLVVAVVTAMVAALMLDRGYGFGVAGIVATILTGPYIAIDSRDLVIMNACVLAAVGAVLVSASLNAFDAIGTIVFVLLAVLVSTLLGRVLEASHRRAFALELEMHRDARTDSLTGLENRRAIQERGLLELKRAERSGAPVSLMLCDVDHFKRINDRFGHEAGDAVLRTVAGTLRAALRETDLLGRWGGEEFIAVLVETDGPAAGEIAERMRAAVAATLFDTLPERMTISLGVATLSEIDGVAAAWESLLKDADRHLYRAKSEGRNRVVTHG